MKKVFLLLESSLRLVFNSSKLIPGCLHFPSISLYIIQDRDGIRIVQLGQRCETILDILKQSECWNDLESQSMSTDIQQGVFVT